MANEVVLIASCPNCKHDVEIRLSAVSVELQCLDVRLCPQAEQLDCEDPAWLEAHSKAKMG